MAEVFEKNEATKDVDRELEEIIKKQTARIKVVGCGGGGGNSISRMKVTGIKGCEIIAVNTDAQDLLYSNADHKILIRVEPATGADHEIPPARILVAGMESRGVGIPRERVHHEDGIRFVRVQLAIGLISESDGTQRSSRLEFELAR